MNPINFKLKVLLLAMAFLPGETIFAAPEDNAQLAAAIAELKGLFNARIDSIEKRIGDVETYSKASYGQIKSVVDELANQKDIQLRAVEAVTGSRDINSLIPTKKTPSATEKTPVIPATPATP